MGTDLSSNHTISLYMGLYNLRKKIKYMPKAATVQGQLMLQEINDKQYSFRLPLAYCKALQISGMFLNQLF